MSLPQIIRKKGPYHRKFGIFLDNLKPYQRDLLKKNLLLRDFAGDDQFILILFKLEEMSIVAKRNDKLYYNPYKDIITSFEEIQRDSQIVDWKCAICGDDIKSIIAEFDIKNLVCDQCGEAHNTKNKIIDSRIVKSSIEFRKYCKSYLLEDQKSYLSYAKKFEKGT